MIDSRRLAVHPQPHRTSDQARDTRARAWAFVFECYHKKEGSRPGAPDAGKEINERSGKAIIPE